MTTTAARAAIGVALAVCVVACEGKRPAPEDAAATTAERVEISRSTHTLAPRPFDAAAAPAGGETDESSAAAADVAAANDDGSLVGEESVDDPRSDTVKIKVIVDARRQAHVTWGRKDFGIAPVEIERPRNSGPLDLIVVAPGYLPLHARALTDRDDVLALRLYSTTEAPQLLGWRPEAAPAPESGAPTSPISPQNKGENARPRLGLPASNGKTGDEKSLVTKQSTKPTTKPTAKKQPK